MEKQTNWLAHVNRIRNITDHEYSVSKDEADYIKAIHDWLINGNSDSIQQINQFASEVDQASD